MTIRTARLTLVPVTLPMVDAALAGNAALQDALGVRVPDAWPHEFLDADAWDWLREHMSAADVDAGWWFHFAVARDDGGEHLVGSCGYKGPPDDDATVEIGYGMVPEQRMQGYASEMADALVTRAFAGSAVRRVIAETMPELAGSIGVLRRCGFTRVDGASEPGVLRFELTREAFDLRPGTR